MSDKLSWIFDMSVMWLWAMCCMLCVMGYELYVISFMLRVVCYKLCVMAYVFRVMGYV